MQISQFELQNSSDLEGEFITTEKFWMHKTIPVAMFMCEFNTAHFEQALFSELTIQLPEELINAVAKRKSEFLAGRYCVKQLAKRLKIPGADSIEVKIGPHRAPIWPLGTLGSITHNTSTALCLLSNDASVGALGLDIENIVAEELMGSISGQVCSQQEIELLLSKGFDHCEAFTLVFSAKESIFKALYPMVSTYFDYKEAILKGVDSSNHRMCFQLNDSFAKKYSLTHELNVDFILEGGVVLTLVTQMK